MPTFRRRFGGGINGVVTRFSRKMPTKPTIFAIVIITFSFDYHLHSRLRFLNENTGRHGIHEPSASSANGLLTRKTCRRICRRNSKMPTKRTFLPTKRRQMAYWCVLFVGKIDNKKRVAKLLLRSGRERKN